jgi:hypothetical protein
MRTGTHADSCELICGLMRTGTHADLCGLRATQVYAEMTSMPLLEIPREQVLTFPRHGYGDMSNKSKRMELNFAANKRLLLSNWNQGARDTGDASFIL